MRDATARSLIAGLLLVGACAPAAPPLVGVPQPARVLPVAKLPDGRQRMFFHWEYRDREVSVNGDGSARIAPPDSARNRCAVKASLSADVDGFASRLTLVDSSSKQCVQGLVFRKFFHA